MGNIRENSGDVNAFFARFSLYIRMASADVENRELLRHKGTELSGSFLRVVERALSVR